MRQIELLAVDFAPMLHAYDLYSVIVDIEHDTVVPHTEPVTAYGGMYKLSGVRQGVILFEEILEFTGYPLPGNLV